MLQAGEGEGEEKLKSRRQSARAAHRRLCIARSDALNALSAFVSWLGAQNKEDFCRSATSYSTPIISVHVVIWDLQQCLASACEAGRSNLEHSMHCLSIEGVL